MTNMNPDTQRTVTNLQMIAGWVTLLGEALKAPERYNMTPPAVDHLVAMVDGLVAEIRAEIAPEGT